MKAIRGKTATKAEQQKGGQGQFNSRRRSLAGTAKGFRFSPKCNWKLLRVCREAIQEVVCNSPVGDDGGLYQGRIHEVTFRLFSAVVILSLVL